MKKTLLFAPILMLALTACNNYRIEGTSSISRLDGKMLFLKVWSTDQMKNIDSCEIVHGKFQMKGKVDSVVMATLYMDDEAMFPVVIENGNIKITINDLKQTVTGTKLNDKLADFIDRRQTLITRFEDLSHKESQMIMDGKDSREVQETINKEGEALSDEMTKLVKDFIQGNYENALGVGVFMILSSNMPYPVMTPQIETLLDNAPDKFKSHPYIKEFTEAAKENMRRMDQNR